MAYVNYIKECTAFIEYASDHAVTANERLLWYALFHVMNQRADGADWPDGMVSVSNKRLLSFLPYSEDSFIRARNRLAQRGLIRYEAGKKNTASPSYAMIHFCQDDTPAGSPPCYPQFAGNMQGKPSGNTTGNMPINMQGNTRGNMEGNSADIISKHKQGNVNPNLNGNPSDVEDADEDDVDDRTRAHMRDVVMAKFKASFGRPANLAEVDEVTRLAMIYRLPADLTEDAIEQAARNGAKNPVAYIRRMMAEWDAEDIRTSEQYHEANFLRYALEGNFPAMAPEDARKALAAEREKRRAARAAEQAAT